jgi:hypothetical protein
MGPNSRVRKATPMNRLHYFVRTFVADDSGVDLLEFAVAGGVIAASAVVTMKDLRVDMLNAAACIWSSITGG